MHFVLLIILLDVPFTCLLDYFEGSPCQVLLVKDVSLFLAVGYVFEKGLRLPSLGITHHVSSTMPRVTIIFILVVLETIVVSLGRWRNWG
jgi:hypothetical protein